MILVIDSGAEPGDALAVDQDVNGACFPDDRLCRQGASPPWAQLLAAGVGLMKEDKLIEYNESEDCFRYDSGCYWEQFDVSSIIFVTQIIADKYKLEPLSTEEWSKDAWKYAEWVDKDAEFFLQMQSKYAGLVYLDHVIDFSETKDGEHTTDTPHGNVKSLEFVAWFNSIPVELLKESEDDVFVERWCE